jgi:hydroxypyruvate isomerase
VAPPFDLAVNLSTVYGDLGFVERLDAAAAAGFEAVEMRWPTPTEQGGRSLGQLATDVTRRGLRTTLLNFTAGDMAGGDRGLAGDPERSSEFRDLIDDALGFAESMGCTKLTVLAGNRRDGYDEATHRRTLVDSVRLAADAAAGRGMTVLIEGLNQPENPRYLVPTPAAVVDVLDEVWRSNARFQLDVYHAARAGLDSIEVIRATGSRIGHVQVADHPGRHEPGTGALDWAAILAALRDAGYQGTIGLEFFPTDRTHPDFGFLSDFRRLAA